LLLLAGSGLPGQVVASPSQEPPATPQQITVARDLPLNPALPTIFVVGDSTARNQADLGWGDHLAHFFDLTRVNIANRAIAGRSSRTYIKEGTWDRVQAEMKKGDFVLIQMGHNDGGQLDGAKPRGTLKGIGDESRDVTLANGEKETVHTYGWYMRKYIADTRAHGATPILLTLTIRNIWTAGADGKQHIERDMGYDEFLRQIAAAEHVALVDMASREADALETLGPAEAARLFPIDHTHTSAEGAKLNAGAVVNALLSCQSPLAAWLVHPLPDAKMQGMHNP
jgi:lysophospholipase L1-like esterase